MFESLRSFLGGREPAGLTAQVVAAAKEGDAGQVQMSTRHTTHSTPSPSADAGEWDLGNGEPPSVQMSARSPKAAPAAEAHGFDVGAGEATPASRQNIVAQQNAAQRKADAAPEQAAGSIPESDATTLRHVALNPEVLLPILAKLPTATLPEVISAHAILYDARKRVRTPLQRDVVKRYHDAVVARNRVVQHGPNKEDPLCITRHQMALRQKVAHGAERRERRLARLKDAQAHPRSKAVALTLPGEGDFSSPPRQRVLGDPEVQAMLQTARQQHIAAEIVKLENFDLLNPLMRKEELEHRLVHCADLKVMREVKNELTMLAGMDSKKAELAARACVEREYRVVHLTVRETVARAVKLLADWESDARTSEALFFGSAGLPWQPTGVSQRYTQARKEMQDITTLTALFSYLGITDPLDAAID